MRLCYVVMRRHQLEVASVVVVGVGMRSSEAESVVRTMGVEDPSFDYWYEETHICGKGESHDADD